MIENPMSFNAPYLEAPTFSKNQYSFTHFIPNFVQNSKSNDPLATMAPSPFMSSSNNNTITMSGIHSPDIALINAKGINGMSTTKSNTTLSASTVDSATKLPVSDTTPAKNQINFQQPIGIIDKYFLLAELGQDHLYPVYLASSLFDSSESKDYVVLKAIPASDYRGSFQNESNIFQLKHHKNLLRCTEIIKNARFFFGNPPPKKEGSKPLPGNGYYHILVLAYQANGDFLDFVKKRKLDERVARYYFGQVLDAVEYLHLNGYCHRDLKIENILLDHNYDLVLTDFGHSVKYRDAKGDRLFIDESSVTTPGICPPEFHKGLGYKGVPMDVFALGKLLLIFVTGFNPFKTAKESDQNYSLILKGQWPTYWKLTQGWMKKKWLKTETFSKDFKSLMESLLHPDPKKRPSIQQIRESNWFRKTQPATAEEVKIAMIRAKNSK